MGSRTTKGPTPSKRKAAHKPSSFEGESNAILDELRARLGDVLEPALGGVDRGATDWARALGVDTKLAWKLTHLLDPSGDLSSLQFVPGRQAFDQILAAAEKRGAESGACQAARDSFTRYESVVRKHAGSRKSFDVLVTSQAPRGRSRAEVNLRRSAVEANASLLGVRAKAQVAIYGFAPNEDGENFDLIGVRKIEGMERMRPNVNWRIARSFRTDDDGAPVPDGPVPLGRAPKSKALAGLAVVPEFSTSPLPDLARVETPSSTAEFEMRGGEVGASARFDLTTAELFRPGETRYADGPGTERARVFAGVRVPCDLLYVDLVVHRELFESTRPSVNVVSTLHTGMALEFRTPDELPIEPEFVPLGRGLERVADPERPTHAELVQWALAQAGWDSEEFDCYRLRLTYPPLPSAVSLDWVRPKRP